MQERDYKDINEVISQYKYVHIIYNDKFCVPFVEFVNEQFDSKEHIFLVQRLFEYILMPQFDNVIEISELDKMKFDSDNIKKVICHSLYMKGIFRYWVNNVSVQKKKAFWMIYGGDLYDAPRNAKADMVRSNFRGYISDTDGDCDVVKEKYKLNNKIYYSAGYSFPIKLEMIDSALKKKKRENKNIRIQINHSSAECTLDMLKELAKFSKENVKIITALSYGDMQCKDEIIRCGLEIFGDKFEYLDEFKKPEEYAEWVSQNDILILNHNRQQGLGNSFASLALGLKLFIKSNVTTYSHFNSRDIRVFDTFDISNISFDDLIYYDEEIKYKNMEKVRMFFSNEYLKKCWEPVFEDD